MTDKTDRKVLLMAYAIAEWTTALDHLLALDRAGVAVPYAILGRIEQQRQEYLRMWWHATHGDPTWRHSRTEQVVTEARAWVTEHQSELDGVLNEKEEQEQHA